MNSDLVVGESFGIDPSTLGLNAHLGVSFSKTTYFSRLTMRRYTEWAADRFNELLIIVADHLEGYNVQVFKGVAPEAAFARTRETGRQLRQAYEHAIPRSLSGRVRVALASELLAEDQCARSVAIVRSVARRCERFCDDLSNSIFIALGNKIDEARQQGIVIDEPAIQILANYLIEEIGIIGYITQIAEKTYPVQISPHFVPPVIRNVYRGDYGDLFRTITHGRRLVSVQVIDKERQDGCAA